MDNMTTFILYFLMKFVCTLTYVVSISNIINYKYKINLKNIFQLVLISIALTIPTIMKIGLFSGLITALVIILYIYIISKDSIKHIAITYILIDVFTIVYEIASGFILKEFTDYFVNILESSLYYKAFLTIILACIIYVLSFTLKKIKLSLNISWSFLFIVFISFFTIATLNYNVLNNSNLYLYELFILMVIIIGFIILISLKVSYKNKHMKQEIKNLNEKNEECIRYIDEFKKYKHNLRYDLIAAEQYGNKKINKILNEIINKGDSDIEYINNLKNIPSSLLSIFMDRLSFVSNESYSIVINNDLNDNEINITKSSDYIKMCEITGNILTNAIEALPEMNGVLVINFYEINNEKYLEVVNNFKNVIDVENIGKIKYSTKKRKSGFGLNSILSEKNFNPQISIRNNFFIIKIKIPK